MTTESTVSAHKFGIEPSGADVLPGLWWGARAIFEQDGRGGYQASLVWDRQQITGEEGKARERLIKWINGKGLASLQKEVNRRRLGPRDSELVEIRDKRAGYVIVADPRASHGYIYIGAARILKPARKPEAA